MDLIFLLIALLFSAFFSGIEMAFVSTNQIDLVFNNQKAGFNQKILKFLTNKSASFITVLLLGNNISIVAYSIIATTILDEQFPINSPLIKLISQTFTITFFVLVFAEFLPKVLFRINPSRSLSIFALPMLIVYVVLFPLAFGIIAFSKFLLKLFFKDDQINKTFHFKRSDLWVFLSEKLSSHKKEEVEHEVKIFHNALQFYDLKARDSMVPRNEIIALEIEDDIASLSQKFTQTGVSKILIYRENIDNIIGYVHIYELFKSPKNIKSILLPINIAPESTPIEDILEELITKKRSITVVLDEYGGTAGMLTVEDVIEEIFGEIDDEHDVDKDFHKMIKSGIYEFSGRLELDFINEKYGLELPLNEEYETLAGYILHHIERIPLKSEKMTIGDYNFEIKKVSRSKINRIKMNQNTTLQNN